MPTADGLYLEAGARAPGAAHALHWSQVPKRFAKFGRPRPLRLRSACRTMLMRSLCSLRPLDRCASRSCMAQCRWVHGASRGGLARRR